MNPNRSLIKGLVCGARVEEIEDPLIQKTPYFAKLIDELAKGKAMEKILRSSHAWVLFWFGGFAVAAPKPVSPNIIDACHGSVR